MAKVSALRGKFKGFFFVLRLDRLVAKYASGFFSNIAYLSAWISKHKKTCGYSDFYSFKFDHNKRYLLFDDVIEKHNLDNAIDYLEFGVSKGQSFKW